MLTYIVLMLFLLFLSICSIKTKKEKRLICIIGILCLGVLMAFKDISIGNDTSNYVYFFEKLQNSSAWYNSATRFEPGYQIFSKLISNIFDEYQYLFISTAVICMFCLYKGIFNYSDNPGFSLFLFVSLRFFYFFLSGLRQAIAVSIIIIAFHYLMKGKIIKYLIAVALATTFHLSALIFILALPISRMKFNLSTAAKMIGATCLFTIFFSPLISFILGLLPEYYSHYLSSEEFSADNLANYIDILIKGAFIILAVFTGYTKRTDGMIVKDTGIKQVTIMDVHMNFMIASLCIAIIATRASLLDRMAQYFWIFSIFSIANIIKKRKYRDKYLMYFGVSAATIVYNITLLVVRPEWNKIVPYIFFWR